MDPDPQQFSGERGKDEILGQRKKIPTRCCCSIVLFIGFSFSLSLFFGLAAIAIENFTAKSPVSVPALCRIVSSSVDIKTSKVCELGLLNYKSKRVLYPLSKEKKRLRCHHDYYWASVFEVEYKEYFSGQVLHGVAEAPKEALPINCRPNFGTAWLTKMKFKVNETYNCRYTLGSRVADFYTDSLFNCQAKDPSVAELVGRVFILIMRSSILQESIAVKGAYMVAGVVSGMLTGVCCTLLLKTLQFLMLVLSRRRDARKHKVRVFAVRLRQICMLVAYFSAVGWLLLEYGKMIGLKQLFSLGSNVAGGTM